MKNMKNLLFMMAFCLFLIGCGENTDYSGIDPQLNIEEYAFPKEGGTLEIYSKIEYDLYIADILDNQVTKDENSITGSWYKVTFSNWHRNLHIEVQANETGKERKLPFVIVSGNFRCTTNYIQKAN